MLRGSVPRPHEEVLSGRLTDGACWHHCAQTLSLETWLPDSINDSLIHDSEVSQVRVGHVVWTATLNACLRPGGLELHFEPKQHGSTLAAVRYNMSATLQNCAIRKRHTESISHITTRLHSVAFENSSPPVLLIA